MSGKDIPLLRYLPAIYAAEPAESPVAALVSLWSDLYGELEDRRDATPALLAPATADGSRNRDFLSWLGSWVALDTGGDIFAENETARPRLRHSIEKAVELYERRGTTAGLRDMAREFLGEEIDIEEWNWPKGLTIGRVATIGIDAFLTDQSDLSHCFVVRWRPRQPLAAAEGPASWQDVPLHRGEGATATIITPAEEHAGAEWWADLHRLRHLLESEKPAHTVCYLTPDLPRRAEPAGPTGTVLIIEDTSTIGCFWIECVA